jgi:nucleoside-triphosphatase
VFLVDELGKMELASERFREAMARLLDEAVPVVATVQQKPHPFVTSLKRRAEIETLQLTAANRDGLPGDVAGRLA